MKTNEDATRLARSIVSTGGLAGLPTRALLTDMDQPLGAAVGNAIEVNETIALLENRGPAEVLDLTIELSAEVLQLCGRFGTVDDASVALRRTVATGAARERFDRMIVAQGGRLNGELPLASSQVLTSQSDGYVLSIDCETLGRCVVEMGGGRRVASDKVDPSVGASVHVRIGDQVKRGQPLLTVYSKSNNERWKNELASVITLADDVVVPRQLLISRITESKV